MRDKTNGSTCQVLSINLVDYGAHNGLHQPLSPKRTGVRKGCCYDHPPSLDLTIRYRGLEVDHYTGTEEVAALSKSNVSLCLSQVPWGNYRQLRRKHGWLFGNQQIDIFGRKDNSVAYCHRHFRNLPVATSQHFSNLTFGDTDAKLIGPGHPPLAGGLGENVISPVVFPVDAALDNQNRRLVTHP